MNAPLLTAPLRAALSQVSATSEDLAGVETDWTGRVHGTALAHVLPSTTAEVAAVLGVCRAYGVGVTVRGGGTGLVAGAVPQDTVVLSTRRLDQVGPARDGSLVAGAGVTIAAVQQRARRAGWDYGVDYASRDTATVGGSVVTNSGGIHVVAYGTTRAQVLGVEAVLADGSIVSRLGGLAKDATGYDLAQLLVGSEGTLGIVTAVRLRLVPRVTGLETALVGTATVAGAVALVAALKRQVTGLRSAELVLPDGIALVRQVAGLPPLFEAGAYVMLEAQAGLFDALENADLVDAAVATDSASAERLWAYRERLTESISTVGVPHKLDVSLPYDALAPFLEALPGVTAPHTAYVFGHIGDGNLHVNVLGPDDEDESVDDAVLRLAASMGGSIGAEHGIGRHKRAWLHLSRSPAELAAMRALKDALDPTGLLNPGVLLP